MAGNIEPVWFVAKARNGIEECCTYHGFLPDWIRSRRAKEWGLLYLLQLDKLEHGDWWAAQPLSHLVSYYREGSLGKPAAVERQRAYEAANEKWPNQILVEEGECSSPSSSSS